MAMVPWRAWEACNVAKKATLCVDHDNTKLPGDSDPGGRAPKQHLLRFEALCLVCFALLSPVGSVNAPSSLPLFSGIRPLESPGDVQEC